MSWWNDFEEKILMIIVSRFDGRIEWISQEVGLELKIESLNVEYPSLDIFIIFSISYSYEFYFNFEIFSSIFFLDLIAWIEVWALTFLSLELLERKF